MLTCFIEDQNQKRITIKPITPNIFPKWLEQQSDFVQQWVKGLGFIAKAETFCLIPDETGQVSQVLVGFEQPHQFWCFGMLASQLPAGHYDLPKAAPFWQDDKDWQRAVLAWGLGSFRANPQAKLPNNQLQPPQLILPKNAETDYVKQWVESIYWVRQLINLPCEEMGPSHLAEAAEELHSQFGAQMMVYYGEDLLIENYPAVYAVGRGSSRAPCLIDLKWGEGHAFKVTLVGKGVCFDSGGLNIKSSAGMRNMKKDMAGAAHVLGLARMIMSQGLPINLRVLIPAVENVISSNSYKPGDILNTRAGLRVEIGNTDAEGRLILGDALTAAIEDKPDLLIDIATLTGAARVALGPELPVYFCNDEKMAQNLEEAAKTECDPIWRLPLYQPYKRFLKSEVADCNNVSMSEFGGAITAALYLQQFVPDDIPWAHFDLMAWNDQMLPGRPIGGEAMALRALYDFLQKQV